ncbi:MAG: hypothetical protein ACWGN7_06370, partial [Thermodesulfovibrionales bacterium]
MDREEELSLRGDLSQTVRELNDAYEELSLLYRLAESLPGLSAPEICSLIRDEAWTYAEAAAVAVLLHDESSGSLHLRTTRGSWVMKQSVVPEESLLCEVMHHGRNVVVEAFSVPGLELSVPGRAILCPMIGKKRTAGLLVVVRTAEQDSYYSNDIKLLGAMAR